MADRFDKSYARRPSADAAARRDDTADLPDDDPLVELARIVSGNESFDQILGSRYQPQPEPPRSSAAAGRGAPQPRDTSYDLEAELLNDLHSSFDPAARPAPRAADPAPVRPVPRAAAPTPRTDNFDHMAVRPSAPAAPPRAAASSAPDPYVAAPDFGRGRIAPEAVQRRQPPPAAPPASREEDDYDDDYVDDDDLRADYDDGDDGYVDDTDFEAEKPRRSRKALITAGVVLVVLVVGGIAAFALKGRTSIGGGAPQVIAADQSPTKIEPEVQPAQSEDTQPNKLIYDRADPDKASPDQLAVPDDGAVDDTAQSNESEASREISRIILPGGPGDQSTTPAVPGAADAPAAADSGDDAGPRKVRTVVVKPDGTIVSSEAAPRGAAPAADAAPAANDIAMAQPAPAADDQAPMAAPAANAPADSAPPVVDSAPTPAPAAPAKDNSQLAAPAVPQPVAAAPTAAPEPPAAVRAPSSGGFVVQVTSQRSEAAAAAAYKNLQKKFPSVLGDRAPDIAKADLGAKGVYFRARVGPMATRDEAVNFCEQLRAAGGDCIVQKN